MKIKTRLVPFIVYCVAWIIWGVAFWVYNSTIGNFALLIGALIALAMIPLSESKGPDGDIVIFKSSDGLKKFLRGNVVVIVFFCVTSIIAILFYQFYDLWTGRSSRFQLFWTGVLFVIIGIIVTIAMFFIKDDDEGSASKVAKGTDDEIIASQPCRELLRILRRKVVLIGLSIVTGFLGTSALTNYGILPGISVILAGFAIGVGIIILDSKYFSNQDDPGDEPTDGPEEEATVPKKSDGALEYLAMIHQYSSSNDCLAPHLNSIVKRAKRLLDYQKNDGVVGEILASYRVFIEQYVGKAAELVKQFRKVREYLDNIDCNKIDDEISHLRADSEGEASVSKMTLDEKLRTKNGLEVMRKKQQSIRLELGLIDATLESMETTAVTAETNDASAKDVRDELQRIISSTTLAIEETLCDHSA